MARPVVRAAALFHAVLVAVLATLAAGADVAAGLYATAERLERGGQIEQAREAYARIVSTAPGSALADDALLALARLAWPIDTPEALGSAAAEGAGWKTAREHLERISSEYVTSDRAPEALWRLGLLLLDPDGPERDPDQAVARLLALPELYPDSPRAPDALALVALLDASVGRDARAVETAFRVLWRWPQAAGATGRAWLAAGRVAARRGETQRALFCLGRASSSGESTGSADRLATLVARIDLRAPSGESVWAIDLDHQLGLPDRVDDLAAMPDGRLFAAMGRENAIAEVDADGRSATRRPQAGVIAVAVDDWSRLWALVPGAVVGPPGAGRIGLPEDLDPSALAVSGARGIWVADRRGRRVVRLGAGGAIDLTVGLADRGDPRALVSDGEGGVIVLDGRNRRLLRIDARGAPAGRIALGGSAGKPIDLDRDVRGDLYVLDAGAGRILVLDRDGKPRAGVALPREGERGIARPERIAVDEAGRIAVYDARRRRLTWLR